MKRTKINQICKNCHKLKKYHEDWIATGEYAQNVVCVTKMDKEGRYLKLQFFEPMDNLDYLEQKYNESK